MNDVERLHCGPRLGSAMSIVQVDILFPPVVCF